MESLNPLRSEIEKYQICSLTVKKPLMSKWLGLHTSIFDAPLLTRSLVKARLKIRCHERYGGSLPGRGFKVLLGECQCFVQGVNITLIGDLSDNKLINHDVTGHVIITRNSSMSGTVSISLTVSPSSTRISVTSAFSFIYWITSQSVTESGGRRRWRK